MKHRNFRTVCLPFLALSAILLCRAGHASAQNNGSDRHKCVIENWQYDVELTQYSGRKTTTTSTRLITGREGDIYTQIWIHYQKGDKVTIHYARIEDMNGNVIRKLKNSDINETQAVSSGSMYMDHFVKYFQLLHNRHPYRLVYSYSVTDRNYIDLLNIAHRADLPLNDATVTLTIPDYADGVHMRYENVPDPDTSKVLITAADYATKYTWKYSYDPYKPEIMPYEGSLGIPKITVVPDKFEYGGVKGSMATWESYGNWYYALNEGLDELPESEKFAIATMLVGVEDDLEKMKILYRYMQDRNRYVNVSTDIGGQKSYPASYVCANRYGDCKALTTYMKAMLKFIGIESHTAAIWLGHRHPEIYDDFPNDAVFNHVINVVPYKGDTIYLECTSKNDPFGYVHSQIQGRKAILTKKSGSHLISIPASKPEEVKCVYNYDIKVDGEGNAAVHFDRLLRGADYEWINGRANGMDKASFDKYIRDIIYSGNYDLLDYSVVKKEMELPEISLTADITAGGFLRTYGKNAVISNFPIYLPPFEHPDKRQSGVEISTPSYNEYILTYDIPSIKPGSLPEPVSIESKYGAYRISYSLDGDKLVVKKSILLNAGIYTLEEYPDFYKFISQVRKEEKSKLNINIL